MNTHFNSIWHIDGTLSAATTPGLSGPGSDDNKWVLLIPQSSSITGTLTSDRLVSYLGHTLLEGILLCRRAAGVYYNPSQMDNTQS